MSRFTLAFFCIAAALQASPAKGAPAPQQLVAAKKTEPFRPFTGKVIGSKVRIRVKPDLESPILKQIDKNDLLLVVGEENDFYAVEPPKETKAYVFRSYILDDRIEANRVNVRVEPHADAPIIGQLKAGDQVKGQICALNHKWLEIPAPKGTRFYVSKEYLTSAGGPDFLATMEKRKAQVEELLNTGFLLAEGECKKSYEEMIPAAATDKFQTVLKSYPDFPEAVSQAKEALALLKETYLNKKITFLESKSELSPGAKEELLAKHRAESAEFFADAPVVLDPALWNKRSPKKMMSQSMRVWDVLEESLYLSWTAFHSGKKIDDFYSEQKANASVLSGTIQNYDETIKDRPGDFILSQDDGSLSYLYSTQIDLSEYVGKTVSVVASQRPNNHFAFPAYFVLSVD